MPKEYVYDCVMKNVRVRLGWEHDSYVQLATVSDSDPVSDSEDKGWYATLDRDGVNRLIRNLRRARDQAFGRDE